MMATTFGLLVTLFAQALVLFYPGVFVFWFLMHNNINRLRPLGIRAYWVAAFAWLVTAGPLLLVRSRLFSVRWSFPQPYAAISLALGAAAFIAGAVVMYKASRQISFRTMVGLPEVEPQKNEQRVLNSGIYSKTRNPLYLGHWLLVFSSAALSNYAANWVGLAADCAALPLLIRAEERELLARYGSPFAEYMKQVPRLVPQWTRRGGML